MTLQSKEAQILGRYIIGREINNTAIERYNSGVEKLGLNDDNRLIGRVMRNPFLLPYADAGLSVLNKNHLLERKLLLMFSVLETMPEYSDKFLPQKQSPFYILYIIFIGIKAGIKTLLGILLIKYLNIK